MVLRAILDGVGFTSAKPKPSGVRAVLPAPGPGLFPNQSGAVWSVHGRTIRRADLIRMVSVAMACNTHLSDAVAESPLKVYREQDGKTEPLDDHKLRALLRRPNAEQSEAEFWASVIQVAGAYGYCLIEMLVNRLNEVIALVPRTPDVMQRRKSTNGDRYWRFVRRGDEQREIPDENVFVVPFYQDPLLERLGVAPLEMVDRDAQIDTSLTDMLKLFLDEGGIPPFILTNPDEDLDEGEIAAAQERWIQKYGKGKAFGAPPIFGGKWEIHPVGLDLTSMAWVELRTHLELRICSAFRVPPHIAGVRAAVENGGLSTTEQAQAMTLLQRHGANPLRRNIAGAVTRSLLPRFEEDPSVLVQFDLSEVYALQEDIDKIHTRALQGLQGGALTVDQYLEVLKLDPLPGGRGQVRLVPFSVTEVPVNQDLGEPEETKSARRSLSYRHIAALTAAQLATRASAGNQNRKRQRQLGEILERKMRTFFREQGTRILSSFRSGTGPTAVRAIEEIDWDEEDRQLRLVMDRFYTNAGKFAFDDAADLLSVGSAWDVKNPRIVELLFALGTRVVDINETTRLEISRIIVQGTQDGLTIDQLAEQLEGLFDEKYKGRAATIARTESQVAYNTAAATAYDEHGITDAELLDNPDHDEDYGASDGLTCAQRNGLIVKVADIPRHVEAEHPNGTLAVAPVV